MLIMFLFLCIESPVQTVGVSRSAPCVSQQAELPLGDSSADIEQIRQTLRNIRATTGARVVVLFTTPEETRRVMQVSTNSYVSYNLIGAKNSLFKSFLHSSTLIKHWISFLPILNHLLYNFDAFCRLV